MLKRLSAAWFFAFVCLFSGSAMAQPEQAMQRFLFATAHCFDQLEQGAYSIPATTFDPVIYTMSVSDEDATEIVKVEVPPCQDELAALLKSCSDQPAQAQEARAIPAAEHSTWRQQLAEPTRQLRVQLPRPQRQDGPSCMSSDGASCESSPAPTAPIEIKASAASAHLGEALLGLGGLKRARKLYMERAQVLAPYTKTPAHLDLFPPTPPPRA